MLDYKQHKKMNLSNRYKKSANVKKITKNVIYMNFFYYLCKSELCSTLLWY